MCCGLFSWNKINALADWKPETSIVAAFLSDDISSLYAPSECLYIPVDRAVMASTKLPLPAVRQSRLPSI